MSVFNAEEFLRPSLESILHQTYRDFELILIDDGSADRTADIIKEYEDPRIRLVRQVNHKLVYSLNKGCELARGEFIARMDADDISIPSRFEKELTLLNTNDNLGVVGGFFSYIDEASSKPTGTVIISPTKHLDLRRTIYINNPFAHGSTMYRKDAFEQAGGYRDTYGPTEDYDLWRRIADQEWELGQVPEILYMYRLNPNGISAQANSVQHSYADQIVEEQWQKSFVFKGYKSIMADGRYYKTMNSDFATQVYDQYALHQFLLAKEMFLRAWFKRACITAFAAYRLDRRRFKPILRMTIGGVLRKLGLKPVKRPEQTS